MIANMNRTVNSELSMYAVFTIRLTKHAGTAQHRAQTTSPRQGALHWSSLNDLVASVPVNSNMQAQLPLMPALTPLARPPSSRLTRPGSVTGLSVNVYASSLQHDAREPSPIDLSIFGISPTAPAAILPGSGVSSILPLPQTAALASQTMRSAGKSMHTFVALVQR
jgi:hypothetical protein